MYILYIQTKNYDYDISWTEKHNHDIWKTYKQMHMHWPDLWSHTALLNPVSWKCTWRGDHCMPSSICSLHFPFSAWMHVCDNDCARDCWHWESVKPCPGSLDSLTCSNWKINIVISHTHVLLGSNNTTGDDQVWNGQVSSHIDMSFEQPF